MATQDPYQVLGVDRKASQDAIRTAYRTLSKQFHPDLNPGKPEAEERFKAIGAAYGILGDAEKRARFDRGEIDAEGHERPDERTFYRDYADNPGGARHFHAEGFADAGEYEDFLNSILRGRGGPGTDGAGGARFHARGMDMSYALDVDFLDAVKGATRRILLPDGAALDVRIPPGTGNGQTLRLKGKGGPGYGDGGPGDAYVAVRVRPHPLYTRKDENIHSELPVSLKEAVLGARVRTPTIDGPVMLTVPKGANTGDTLRLKGKGVPDRTGKRRGDQYVTLRVVLPDKPDPALEAFCRDWTPAGDGPRGKAGGGEADAA